MTLFAGLLLTLSTGLGYSHPGYGAAAILESEPVHLEASVLSIEKNDGGSGIGGNLLAEVKLGWVWIGGEWTRQSVEHYSSGEVLPRVRLGRTALASTSNAAATRSSAWSGSRGLRRGSGGCPSRSKMSSTRLGMG